MNQARRPTMIRAIAAAFAVVATLSLFEGVVSLSEPQRSTLVAASQAREAPHVAQALPTVAGQAIVPAGVQAAR